LKKPDLTYFFRETKEGPTAILLDVDAKRDAKKPLCVELRVPFLKKPDANGLRAESESPQLYDLESLLLERLHAFRYVGFYDVAGAVTFVLYAPKKATTEDTVRRSIGDIAPYTVAIKIGSDPKWSFYEVLSPDDYEIQHIWNDASFEELQHAGDATDVAREIDHWASFPSAAVAKKAAEALKKRGFHIDPGRGREICFHRDDKPDDAHAFSDEILDIVLPLKGSYEWGTTVVAKPSKKR
jgi:hypothetical protein